MHGKFAFTSYNSVRQRLLHFCIFILFSIDLHERSDNTAELKKGTNSVYLDKFFLTLCVM